MVRNGRQGVDARIKAVPDIMVQAVLAPEVGYAAFRRYASAAEKNRGGGAAEHDPKGRELLIIRHAVEWVLHHLYPPMLFLSMINPKNVISVNSV